MISRSDCFLLIDDLKHQGIDVREPLKELTLSRNVPVSVVQFINSKRRLELSEFYEKLRKNYNKKTSKLYGNVVKEIKNPNEVLTTLSSFLTQILLYSEKVEDKEMFLRHARAKEISTVLTKYFIDFDLTSCVALMQLLKADIKALENK